MTIYDWKNEKIVVPKVDEQGVVVSSAEQQRNPVEKRISQNVSKNFNKIIMFLILIFMCSCCYIAFIRPPLENLNRYVNTTLR